MIGVLPLSLSLTDDSARIIGAYVRSGLVDVVRPPLDRIDRHLLDLRNMLRMLSVDVIDVFKGVTDRRLKVQVMNEELLDHIEATRWAVAYFSYNTFLELLEIVRYMNWLNWRSHLHLHDIINILYDIENLLGSFASVMFSMGDTVIVLLQMILDQLRHGIGLTGTIQIIVTGAEPLKDLDLLKLLGLLGLLALGLTIIVAFLFGVGAALRTFTAGAILAAGAVVLLANGLIPLINTLVKFEGTDFLKIGGGFALIAGFVAGLGKAFQLFTTDLGKVIPYLNTFFDSITKLMNTLVKFEGISFLKIGVGFALIAGFVAGLGKAFQLFTTDLGKVIPYLNTFFDSITKLMNTLVKFKGTDLLKIGGGFALIAGFVALLGLAFQQFKSDLSKLLPQLNAFLDSITNLMKALAKFTPGQMITIAVGFLLIAGFVWLLGKALGTLSQQAISAIEPLAKFFTAITALMVALATFGFWDMVGIAVGFLLIAGFVYLLSRVLNTLTEQAVKALPAMATLIGALATLASTLGNMSGPDLIGMTFGLAVIAGFVWAVAAALVYAAGPLETLAKLFDSFGSALSLVTGIAGKLWGVLSTVGSGIRSVAGTIVSGISDVTDVAGKIVSGIGGVVDDIGSGISDAVGAAVGGIEDAAGAVGDFFGGIGDSLFGSIDVNALMGGGGGIAVAAALPPALPPALAAPAGVGAVGAGGALAAAPVGGPTTVDQTVNAGGINITITADRLEADSGKLLTDDILAQLLPRLDRLRATQDFQGGGRPAAVA